MNLTAALFFVLLSFGAYGQQSDPSVVTFTSSSVSPTTNVAPTASPSNADDPGLETNRYVKKPQPAPTPPKKVAKKKKSKESDGESADADSELPAVNPLPALAAQTFDGKAIPQPTPAAPQDDERNFGKKLRDLILGGDLELIDKYRTFLDADDVRKNLFEFTMATSYFYNSSSSPYFFRNYIDSSPCALVGLDLWLTPFVAIDGDYRFSLLNELKDSPTQDNFIDVAQTWYKLGLKFRRFFGMAINSPILVVGLKYSDYSLAVPPSSVSRLKQHTSGVELSFDLSIPASKYFMWDMGFLIQPFSVHEETVASSDLRAGTSNQTTVVGANFGGEYRMSRNTIGFFKLSALLGANRFSGSALSTDPVTGLVPSNVPVNNVFYFLDLGLRLGL